MDNQKTEVSNPTVQDEDSLDKIHVSMNENVVDPENESIEGKPALQSHFLEVRSAVEAVDDVNMASETFRAYAISIFLCSIASVITNITSQREEPLFVEASVIQLVSFPVGKLWARWMPYKTVRLGKWSFKLNPGPFTVKEHALIVVMANVCYGSPYGADLIVVQIVKYGEARWRLI